ncbi:peptidase S8/S53 domain-containing protein [Podospora aff. communis PSN243]|uniref:Peptidase S8/S53 domain-containing protein n=1 Tax=Podospora aff. communis PSN243 TaxID=3040156 RepID=A0AAV9GQX7_9PEZI|nr:peptidase S8/S53 domain-containing protein [Podospora aff. communis PSN243]
MVFIRSLLGSVTVATLVVALPSEVTERAGDLAKRGPIQQHCSSIQGAGFFTGLEIQKLLQSFPLHGTARQSVRTSLALGYLLSVLRKTLCKFADNYMVMHHGIYSKYILNLGIEETANAKSGRVKVAILDTGLDLSHHEMQARSERIRVGRTWLGNPDGEVLEMKSSPSNDPHGHGTHITGFLLDIAPDCDVYVAQIADSTELRPNSATIIAKAVKHAVEVWKVDIISMSFGFTDEREPGCEELREALGAAYAAKVLLFAAASNSGAHRDIPSFPARMNGVFCIFASNGMGGSSIINPSPSEAGPNFTTLGEAVCSA